MKNLRNAIGAALAASLLVLGVSACEKKQGPMERAGKAVDKSVESAGEKIERAGEKIQDAARDAKK